MNLPVPVGDVPFSRALKDRTAGNPRILKRDYLSEGALPIVDQGASLVAGYTNDTSSAYSGPLPAIVFGDHTRRFKYVDFPFAIGADGLKVLDPAPGFESRYLYYYLLAQDIPSRGYSRHFHLLRNIRIACIHRSDQRRIVEILDRADRLRRLRSESDTKADRILPALFLKMFGDPGTNPMGWPSHTLGEIAILGPQYGANAASTALSDGEPRYLRITDIRHGGRLSKEPVGVDLADWERYRLQEGDLLFARSGATVGKPYIYRDSDGLCVFAGYLIRFRLDAARLHPLVAFAFTQTPFYRRWIERKRRTAAQPNINGREYASLRLPVPDRELQAEFVCFHRRLTGALDASVLAASALGRLFSLTLNRAFAGSLTPPSREHLGGLSENGEG